MPGDPYPIEDQPYDPARGVNARGQEGGNIVVELSGNEVLIAADPAGLRDLARWCLALAAAPEGCHIHMDPDVSLATGSESLIIAHSASGG